MSDKDILEKVIQKAIDGGWKRPKWSPNISVKNLAWDSLDGIPYWQSFVYSHDFAKALWGEREFEYGKDADGVESVLVAEPGWKYHLQEMAIAKDPIKYLGDNI